MKCLRQAGFLFITLLIICSITFAIGENTIHYWLVEETEHANLGILYRKETFPINTMILLFPGCSEYDSLENAREWVNSYQIYDNIDAYVILVTAKNSSEEEYLKACNDALDYIASLYAKEQFDIILDCVSMGGGAGTYLAEKALERGISIKEIVYADAMVSKEGFQDRVEALAISGIKVSAYSSNDERTISNNTRNIIDNLNYTTNFYGVHTLVSHWKVLHEAIYTYGLHSELMK